MNDASLGEATLSKAVSGAPAGPPRNGATPALGQFLDQCLAAHATDFNGAVADYIPQLSKANPAHFGIALATIDGHVYESGDCAVEFTIQSISKAFVFALALELAGAERVERRSASSRAAKPSTRFG